MTQEQSAAIVFFCLVMGGLIAGIAALVELFL